MYILRFLHMSTHGQNISSTQGGSSVSQTLPYLWLCHHLFALPVVELHRNGTTLCGIFRIWLRSFTATPVSFIHFRVHNTSLFLFTSMEYSNSSITMTFGGGKKKKVTIPTGRQTSGKSGTKSTGAFKCVANI